MDTLRQFHGIAGFQKRKESEYDCFEAGHSSTSLSAGLGMAIARDLNGEDYKVICVIGDGALNTGLSLEALNEIGFEKRNIIILFNDNNMSISRNVGALTRSFAKMRNSSSYNDFKDNVKGFLKGAPYGASIIRGIHEFKDSIKKTIVDSGVFKEFDIDYIGPVDGHDMKELIDAFEKAKRHEGPVVVHCVTVKGKGYSFAEEDRSGKWHGVPRFEIGTGRFLNETPKGSKSCSLVVSETMEKLMEKDPDILTITPAMISGSCLGNLFARYPDRCFDCGIAEGHALTLAAGMALDHKKPFVSVYSSFLQRAYDQLNHDICRMDLPVVIGVDRAGIVGEDGDTHHGVFDISFARALPHIVIAQGKDAKETSDLLYTGFTTGHPYLLRYPRGVMKTSEYGDFSVIPVGKWEFVRNNKNEDVIISYGPDVLSLQSVLEENDLTYDLVNARFLKPVDTGLLDELIERNANIFVYTCDILKGGLGDEILEYLNQKGAHNRVTVIGIDDVYVSHGSTLRLKEELGIDIRSFIDMLEKERHA